MELNLSSLQEARRRSVTSANGMGGTRPLRAGRWAEVRGPSESELNATSVLEFSIGEAFAKVRSGPPLDGENDTDRGVGWRVTAADAINAANPRPQFDWRCRCSRLRTSV